MGTTSPRLTKVLLTVLLAAVVTSCTSFKPALPIAAKPLDETATIQRIALGSCFHTLRSDRIFATILKSNPDIFLFIGDNVYAEDESFVPRLISLRRAYGQLATAENFARLREQTPLLVTWDDHDYGTGDGGADFGARRESEALFEHVWVDSPTDSRTSRDGVYYSKIVGPNGKRVQFIMLDLRFFRTPLTPGKSEFMGHYVASSATDQNMLGKAQWQWFEQELRKEADLRIITTSIQLVADGHAWESWRLMPRERTRFYDLIKRTKAGGVIAISGDRHSAAIYRHNTAIPYPLYEVTSSSLNVPLTLIVKNPKPEPGPHRLGGQYYESNFGMIEVDWATGQINLSIRDENGDRVRAVDVNLDELK